MNVSVKTLALTTVAGALSAGASAHAAESRRPDASRAATSARHLYDNGGYRARGWYGSLPSSITVRLRVRKDVIRDVEVTPHATDPTSLDYQRRFARAVPDVVVGKPLESVRVGRLAGSSGTPDGFNDAVRKIRRQAGQ